MREWLNRAPLFLSALIYFLQVGYLITLTTSLKARSAV